jgi:hypothetical protein
MLNDRRENGDNPTILSFKIKHLVVYLIFFRLKCQGIQFMSKYN